MKTSKTDRVIELLEELVRQQTITNTFLYIREVKSTANKRILPLIGFETEIQNLRDAITDTSITIDI